MKILQNRKYGSSIFVVPVYDKFLLYAPLHDISVLLNKPAVLDIKAELEGNPVDADVPQFLNLIQLLKNGPVQNPERTGELNPQFLGIIPSRRCNLSCVYCDFGAHHTPNGVIDPKFVVTAIDWYAEWLLKQKRQILPLQFFGGEPFVESNIIDVAVHRARFVASQSGLIPYFEVLTNGFFNETQRTFIQDYFDRVLVSFDGFKKYHDFNRPRNHTEGSYQTIVNNLKYLSDTNVELAIRCCITSESVHEMESMSHWFCETFHPDIVNFETLTPNTAAGKAGLHPSEPVVFARHCVRSWRILRSYGVDVGYASVSLDPVQTTSCPVGRDTLIVHPDGMIASCYLMKDDWEKKGLDLSVGCVNSDGTMTIDVKKIDALRNPVYEKIRCKTCFCRFSCAGNCHVNTTYPDCSTQYTDFCYHTRIMTACQILESMDQYDLADRMLESLESLTRLNSQCSDHLFDFKRSMR